MKNEIKEILVISNSPTRDIQEFSRYCKSYIDKCESHKIYMKDGYILRFRSSHNLNGVRKYYPYYEIFETYLKNYITNLQEELKYQKEAEQEYNEKHTILMEKYKKLQQENQELKTCKSRIDKSNEYIKENTRWFDCEYAKIYGELVDCAGLKGDRLEVLVNPSNLSKILGGDKDVKD